METIICQSNENVIYKLVTTLKLFRNRHTQNEKQ